MSKPKEIVYSGPNTYIPYLYRDGSNYKASNYVILAGNITDEEIKQLKAKCDEGEMFIPGQLGLRDLQSDLVNFPSPDDHVWHELLFGEIESTEEPVSGDSGFKDVHAFVRQFCKVKEWDVLAASKRVGLEV